MLDVADPRPDFQQLARAEEVVARLRRFVLDQGFDAVVFAVLDDSAPANAPRNCGALGVCLAGKRDVAFCARDPVCVAARARMSCFLWSSLAPRRQEPCAATELRRLLPDLDLGCVGTVPIHGPRFGLALSVAALCEPAEFQRRFHDRCVGIQSAAIAAQQRLMELAGDHAKAPDLTERQRDVLFWIVQGKTNWEIGQIIGISADTVRQHVGHIAGLFKVSNRVQVTAAAVTRGICAPLNG